MFVKAKTILFTRTIFILFNAQWIKQRRRESKLMAAGALARSTPPAEMISNREFRNRKSLRSRKIKPGYGGRSVSRRLSGAGVCARVAAGAPGWRGPLSSSCAHENRVGVCVCASMTGKSVS